jgi:predicted Zn-dependent protease
MTDYLIGDVDLRQNHLDEAQQYLTKALELSPGLADAQLDLAKVYHAQARTDDAIKLLQSVVASDPSRQDAHYLLFELYKERGQTEAARKELKIFLELKQKSAAREQKMNRLDSIN